MKSCWHLLLIGAGLALIMTSFVYNVVFAGIPYQDPPPELAARYAFHVSVANALFWLGSGVFLAGVIMSVLSFVMRRFRG
jgi:hypothetical protein